MFLNSKPLAVLLALTALLMAVACGGGGGSNSTSQDSVVLRMKVQNGDAIKSFPLASSTLAGSDVAITASVPVTGIANPGSYLNYSQYDTTVSNGKVSGSISGSSLNVSITATTSGFAEGALSLAITGSHSSDHTLAGTLSGNIAGVPVVGYFSNLKVSSEGPIWIPFVNVTAGVRVQGHIALWHKGTKLSGVVVGTIDGRPLKATVTATKSSSSTGDHSVSGTISGDSKGLTLTDSFGTDSSESSVDTLGGFVGSFAQKELHLSSALTLKGQINGCAELSVSGNWTSNGLAGDVYGSIAGVTVKGQLKGSSLGASLGTDVVFGEFTGDSNTKGFVYGRLNANQHFRGLVWAITSGKRVAAWIGGERKGTDFYAVVRGDSQEVSSLVAPFVAYLSSGEVTKFMTSIDQVLANVEPTARSLVSSSIYSVISQRTKSTLRQTATESTASSSNVTTGSFQALAKDGYIELSLPKHVSQRLVLYRKGIPLLETMVFPDDMRSTRVKNGYLDIGEMNAATTLLTWESVYQNESKAGSAEQHAKSLLSLLGSFSSFSEITVAKLRELSSNGGLKPVQASRINLMVTMIARLSLSLRQPNHTVTLDKTLQARKMLLALSLASSNFEQKKALLASSGLATSSYDSSSAAGVDQDCARIIAGRFNTEGASHHLARLSPDHITSLFIPYIGFSGHSVVMNTTNFSIYAQATYWSSVYSLFQTDVTSSSAK